MNGQLFTQDFLLNGIRTTPVWTALDEATFDAFAKQLRAVYGPYTTASVLNEAITEDEIIVKVLALLDWSDLTLRQVASSNARREDVPDILLFPDAAAKRAALKERRDDRRYRHGIAILESKRWMRPLDRGDATDRLDPGTPSNQILRYLSRVEIASEGAVRWGILTNGAIWRLYYQGARSRAEEFLEVDLAALVGVPGSAPEPYPGPDARHGLKVFFCLFHHGAFLAQSWDAECRSFHDYALREARLYEEKVSQDLGERVFATVFPDLASALAAGDPQAPQPFTRAYLDEVREAALILLYRLLFVLYAEDRRLLPVRDSRYREYSLQRLREEIREKYERAATFSATAARIWDDLRNLFSAIARGDGNLGLPAYNGGLFEEERAPLLARARVPDARLAPLLDALSCRCDDPLRGWINYRDLSVQHLGSIYERLLEFRLEADGGRIVARPNSFARKVSGSYYTHDDLVKLLVTETVDPLLEEKRAAFDGLLEQWKRRRELKPADWNHLDSLDPASGMLDLRICDPAMGSGHFLVSLVDYLADQVLEAVAHAAEAVAAQTWARKVENPWVSPLVARIADIRSRILAGAREHGWSVAPEQLDDRHIVRRMILKRVIHGVDKNPMAVELAKVALWLHTFTVGAPLSFLDHHLRCGDALHGERIEVVRRGLIDFGVMFQEGELMRLEAAARHMSEIADLTDVDVAEAHRSKALLDRIEEELAPLKALQDFWRALRWLEPAWPDPRRLGRQKGEWAEGLAELLSGRHMLAGVVAAGHVGGVGTEVDKANAVLAQVRALAARERFLHWPTAFPGVWADADPARRGFDAVIGNPPWDRIKLQEVEWFAERRPEIALATRAADRKRLIAALQKKGDPLWLDYVDAQAAAETAARVARECGDYPLLSGGDINLYSLFVERAAALVHRRGMVGLLTPSGIAADKGAAAFFRTLSGTGRLAALYDFENRKVFFPDVDSRFKFVAIVFGGEARTFGHTRCAFYLHAVSELADPERILTLAAADFAAVNPNTGAAPIFRSRRDADITVAIYRRQPVLVDRLSDPPRKLWPVRYCTMFHMTNDSHLFKRREELEREGWYPVAGNRWKKGEAVAVPLYVGRMIYTYDHRSSSVTTNEENLHNAALSANLSITEKAQPDLYPVPQYWVSESDIPDNERRPWAICFRDIARATDMRTMIAAVIPTVAAGNTLPLLLPDHAATISYPKWSPLFLANLNSLAFDYVTRQKTQSTHINWYIVEQLPLIRPEQFEQALPSPQPSPFGRASLTVADFVRGEVLHLSYTAHDLAPFARDLGYDGPPFRWDEEERRHRMARLDALFFHLYGIGRIDAAYILDTFPIVREQDEKAFGRYRTKELVLAYMNAVAAGDFDSVVRL
jgi:hypothetical protein